MYEKPLTIAGLFALVEEVERDLPFRPALQLRDIEARNYLADPTPDPHDECDGCITHRRALEREGWIQENVENNQPFTQKAAFV